MNGEDYILIKGRQVSVDTRDLNQEDLSFWTENPRVYSLFDRSEGEPSQDEIFEKLLKLEHVRELKYDIKDNKGLMEPVIVREGDWVVVEGNSRLAAYRALAKDEPFEWSKIRCKILPKDISESEIYVLLGQFHVRGRKDWVPYEKAGFMYRRHVDQDVSITSIAKELGISHQKVKHHLHVYRFMKSIGEESREKWSHYDEFFKSRKIQKASEEFDGLEEKVVKLIRKGKVRAVDIRNELPKICTNKKVLRRFIKGATDFHDAAADARYEGADSVELNRIERFMKWICDPDIGEELIGANQRVRNKIDLALGKIESRARILRKQVARAKTK